MQLHVVLKVLLHLELLATARVRAFKGTLFGMGSLVPCKERAVDKPLATAFFRAYPRPVAGMDAVVPI